MKLTATYKGLLTGALMIAASLLIYVTQKSFDNNLQYTVYLLYLGGIVWTLASFAKAQAEPVKFAKLFAEGFKCFIVVTLLMVLFTIIFLKAHPEFKEQMATGYKAELEKQKNYTPKEIEEMVQKSKSYFVTMLTSMAVFSYLVIGALVTAVTGAVLLMLQKTKHAA
ncbi:MAG TPA: DUF4199 family protein [Ferruginibacter sp.]|nr:DUF4199 family protein [Ferruginibacter sp.]HMP22413.1 DUF4199 family protein [Ferruginibacter sp.]